MNPYTGLDAATLATLKTAATACLTAILLNQSYALNGRSLTRANLSDVQEMIGLINGAIADLNGDTASETYVNFTGNDGSYPNSF